MRKIILSFIAANILFGQVSIQSSDLFFGLPLNMTLAEKKEAGIARLTPTEIKALNSWLVTKEIFLMKDNLATRFDRNTTFNCGTLYGVRQVALNALDDKKVKDKALKDVDAAIDVSGCTDIIYNINKVDTGWRAKAKE